MGRQGPHIVPITFAIRGDEVISAVDHKPKRTKRLQRLINIEAYAAVTLLVDHYSDDWEQLWWVRADGLATIIESGTGQASAVDLLVAKYDQYKVRRPTGPVISVAVDMWTGWQAHPRVSGG